MYVMICALREFPFSAMFYADIYVTTLVKQEHIRTGS